MKTNLRLLPAALAGVSGLLVPLARADYFQAPYGPGGTWRIYETVRPVQTMKAALADARASVDPVTQSVPGDLVSITSLGKNTFIYRSVGRVPGDTWIGLTDREGVATGAFESQGEPDNRAAGWAWTNGDPYAFQNFGAGEPNDSTGEDAAHIRGDSLWNDHKSGFGIDDPVSPSIKGGTSLDETAAPAFGYVVEYPIDSPTPLPNIRYGMAFPPCVDFGLPLNDAGEWSVREIRGLTLAGNIHNSIDYALSGEGSVFDGQATYLDFTDPDTNPNGGPVLTTTPFPYLSDTVGLDDENILTIARTRIRIDAGKAGLYTIQVRGDDGFALRIKGVPWVSVEGGGDVNRGYIDPLDPTALIFERGTGDANTKGVINLAAGEYDVEFVHWEGGGGANYEVTATSGDATIGQLVQWQPFGSGTDLPAIDTKTAVRLGAPAVVQNANVANRQDVLPAIRHLFANARQGITSAPFDTLVIGEGAMPNNNGGDNYITRVTGQFTVDADANGNSTPNELIDVTFRLNCDDGASLRIIGQDFLAVNGGNNRVLLDNEGDMTMTADIPTGDTDLRGLVQLTEGQTYSFVSYMYEYGGGSKYELYWNVGNEVDANLSVANPLSTFGAVALTQSATVSNLAHVNWDSQASLPDAAAAIDLVTPQIGVNAGIFSALDIPETSMPNNNGGDNYATRVTGKITLNADANGNSTPGETIDVTFRLSSDDGSDLRIVGESFDATNGGTTMLVDVSGDLVLTGDFPTGDANAIGRIKLTEGQTYDFVSRMFEFGGGSKYQLFWQLGDKTGGLDAETVLSNVNTDAVYISSEPDPVNEPGLTGALVVNAPFGSRQSLISHAAAIIDDAATQNLVQQTTVTTVILRGEDTIGGRPGANVLGTSTLFPVGLNQDNFITRVSGEIIVDDQDGTPGETLTLTFGIFGDDAMDLRIVGQDFNLATDTTADGVAYLRSVNGDATLSADYWSGNTAAFGRIDLVEGDYTFVMHHIEGGGGAGAEVWYAVGDKTAGFDDSFRPLNDQTGSFVTANFGIPLIASVNDDADGDGLPAAWETANGLSDANANDADLDNDGDGQTNREEYAAGTNPNNAASAFRISLVALGGGGIQVSIPTMAGHHYTLIGSETLEENSWTEYGRALPDADATTTWTIPAPASPPPNFFFKVVAEPCD